MSNADVSSPESRLIKIVSPKAPSGIAWLINALICLGIRVGRSSSPSPGTFVRCQDGSYSLNEAEENLKLHFPVLAQVENFSFRKNLVVEWVHDWPGEEDFSDQIFLFVRDPRDALYSLYRRRNVELGFEEFLKSLDLITLLNQVDAWRLFVDSWMAQDNVTILRFEDFKMEAEKQLSYFLSNIGVTQPDLEIMRYAVDSSRFENARKVEDGEKKKLGSYFRSGSALNRKGMPFEWKSQYGEYEREYDFISSRCIAQLAKFGYEQPPGTERPNLLHLSAKGLVFNESMPENLMREWVSKLDTDQKVSILKSLEDFARYGEKKYGFYEPWEIRVFEENMAQFVRLVLPEHHFSNHELSGASAIAMVVERLLSKSARAQANEQ